MRQVRLSQLEKVGKSLQSKVRRLAEADPKMTQNIEQLDQILQTITNMSGQVTVQFRIYARGDSGDFEVLQATSAATVSSLNRLTFPTTSPVPQLARTSYLFGNDRPLGTLWFQPTH